MSPLAVDELAIEPRPDEWRRPLGPVALLWLATAAAAVRLGQAGWYRFDELATAAEGLLDRRGRMVIVAGLLVLGAWGLAGLLGLASGRVVERMWLASGWGPVGTVVRRGRGRRWSRAAAAADAARSMALSGSAEQRMTHLAQFRTHARRRNRIALAEPQRPGWMSDRVAALEARIENQHGLDLATIWPRLWLLLPEPAKVDLRLARAVWSNAAHWAGWGALFLLVGVRWWPGLVPGAALLGWGWVHGRTALDTFANLVEAAVDLYAADLARALGVVLPSDGRVDYYAGQTISSLARKGV